MKITAIYPGTFDPITNGHTDIVLRATRLFDQVIIAVAEDTGKRTAFNAEERVALARTVLGGIAKVEVCAFSGLVTAFTRKRGARVIIRGLRAVSDFDYEFQMAEMNQSLDPSIEYVFLPTSKDCSFISSTLVREIAEGLSPPTPRARAREGFRARASSVRTMRECVPVVLRPGRLLLRSVDGERQVRVNARPVRRVIDAARIAARP